MKSLAHINWNIFILHQFYEEDNDIFELFHRDIREVCKYEKLNFYFLKHDIRNNKADIFKSDQTTNYEFKLYNSICKLNNFFSDFVLAKNLWVDFFNVCPNRDKNNFVIIQGHGAGLGFCPKETGNKIDIKKFFKIERIFSNHIMKFAERKIQIIQKPSGNSTDIEIPIIPTIVFCRALEDCFKPGGIEFLCFSNCFMQCIETGFVFKNIAKYLVASQGIFISTGLNFPKLYELLSSESDNEKIASSIATELDARFENETVIGIHTDHNEDIIQTRNIFALSVNRLFYYDRLKILLSTFSGDLLNEVTASGKLLASIEKIRNDKKVCRDVFGGNPIGIIDLCNFLYLFCLEKELSGSIRKQAYQLINFIRHKVVASSQFPRLAFDSNSKFGICPFGISIYFPKNKKQFPQNEITEQLFEQFYKKPDLIPNFLMDNRWHEWVIFYYDRK